MNKIINSENASIQNSPSLSNIINYTCACSADAAG
jgi:hypothetical protein